MRWRWADYRQRELILVHATEQERANAGRGIARLGTAGDYGATTASRLDIALEAGHLPWEVLKSLSSWCDSEGKYAAGVAPAREISLALFNQHVLPRLTSFRGDRVTERIARERFAEFAQSSRILDAEFLGQDQLGQQSSPQSMKTPILSGNATISYKRRAISDVAALVNAYGNSELASPLRSTVPLLAYWADPMQRLVAFDAALGIDDLDAPEFAFEYTVPVQAGTGKESHTDLMLRSQPRSLAIEGKYTEPKYQTVRDWLGPVPSTNRTLVLGGWLDLINQATGSALEVNDILDCTYQLVHRTASVCESGSEKLTVVYQCFDHEEGMLDHHLNQLGCLSRLIGRSERISFHLFAVSFEKTPEYQALQDAWTAGNRDLSTKIRAGLLSRCLLEFGHSSVIRV